MAALPDSTATNLLTHMAMGQVPVSLMKVRLKGMILSETSSLVVAQA